MTFLKKLGQILATVFSGFLSAAPIVGPLLTGFLGSNAKAASTVTTIINDLTSIGQVVVQTEAILQGDGNGAQKLAAATPLVANIVQTSELVSGHKIVNEALFIAGCQKITSGVADVLNSLDSSKLPNPPATASTASAPLPSV
jgi:hypothetical protein